MNKKDILRKVDHTVLKVDAGWNDIKKVLDDAMEYNCATACIPPCFVANANYYVDGNLPICTVIGFPNGYSSTETKCFETKQAISDGASEIDMVVNISAIKDKKYDYVLDEIKQIAQICNNHIVKVPLKVIIETCLLTDEEKIKMCEIIAEAGADYVKTSTGFSLSGATVSDIKLLRKEVDKLNNIEKYKEMYPNRDKIRIKAAGGIKDFDDAQALLDAGADRLGTSRLIK